MRDQRQEKIAALEAKRKAARDSRVASLEKWLNQQDDGFSFPHCDALIKWVEHGEEGRPERRLWGRIENHAFGSWVSRKLVRGARSTLGPAGGGRSESGAAGEEAPSMVDVQQGRTVDAERIAREILQLQDPAHPLRLCLSIRR